MSIWLPIMVTPSLLLLLSHPLKVRQDSVMHNTSQRAPLTRPHSANHRLSLSPSLSLSLLCLSLSHSLCVLSLSFSTSFLHQQVSAHEDRADDRPRCATHSLILTLSLSLSLSLSLPFSLSLFLSPLIFLSSLQLRPRSGNPKVLVSQVSDTPCTEVTCFAHDRLLFVPVLVSS